MFGRTPPQWLTDPNDARAAIILMSLFTIGETFVMLLAARRACRRLYELAAIEDATGWDVFRRVTLPLMAPVLVLLLLRDTILSLQFTFVPALVVTDGGPPPYATTYLPLFVYRNALRVPALRLRRGGDVVMLLLTVAIVLLSGACSVAGGLTPLGRRGNIARQISRPLRTRETKRGRDL